MKKLTLILMIFIILALGGCEEVPPCDDEPDVTTGETPDTDGNGGT